MKTLVILATLILANTVFASPKTNSQQEYMTCSNSDSSLRGSAIFISKTVNGFREVQTINLRLNASERRFYLAQRHLPVDIFREIPASETKIILEKTAPVDNLTLVNWESGMRDIYISCIPLSDENPK